MSPFKKPLIAFLILTAATAGVPFANATSITQSNQKGQNLLTYSENLSNNAWIKGSATVSYDASIINPSGGIGAYKILDNAVNGLHYVYHSTITGFGTESIYLKAGTKNFATFSTNSDYIYVINLTTGVLSVYSSSHLGGVEIMSSQNVGGGWWRVNIVKNGIMTGSGNQSNVFFGPANSLSAISYAGDGLGSVYAWGAQVTMDNKPAAYNRTTASALNSTFVPTGVTKSNQKGQNLLTYSEQFDNAAWTKRGTATVTPDQMSNPLNGAMTADLITGFGTFLINDLYLTGYQTILGPPGVAYTPSFWIKRVSSSGTIRFANPQNTNIGQLNINLATIGSGWVRIYPGAPGITVVNQFKLSLTGAGGIVLDATAGAPLSFYLWGAQEVLGAQPAAYNRTVASALNSTYIPTGVTKSQQKGQNLLIYSEQFNNSNWNPRGTCTVTANQKVNPVDSAVTADLVAGVGISGNDIYQYIISVLPAGVSYTPSVWIKRVSTTGTLNINNSNTTANGLMTVNLSLIGSGWVRIYPGQPGVTLVTPFTASVSGNVGLQFTASAGGPLSFYLWGAQAASGAKPAAYNRTTSAALNSTYVP